MPPRLRAATLATGAGVGAAAVSLFSRDFDALWALCFGAAIGLGAFAWRSLLRRGSRSRLEPWAVGLSALLLVLGVATGPLGWGFGGDRAVEGCADPVELTVLLPVDGAAGLQEAIAEFNARPGEGDCRTANVTAYDAPWGAVELALRQGWEPDAEGADEPDGEPLVPLRDVGPRPHLWITESQTYVDLASDALRESAVGSAVLGPPVPIGETPLVLAVPGGTLTDGFNGASQVAKASLPEMLDELDAVHGVSVLRSDPSMSHTGLLFLRALYADDAVSDGTVARFERKLANWGASLGIALSSDDTGLLCGLSRAQDPSPDAAVLTTEAALARYNTGKPMGAECPVQAEERSDLLPVYSEAFGALDYQAVRLDWEDGDGPWERRRAAVADDLVAWLAGGGGSYPARAGVRSVDYDGEPLLGEVQFAKRFAFEAEPIGVREYWDLREDYGTTRAPADVLLSIDRSRTMHERDSGGPTRFELATEGVATALEYLGPEDRAGLWTFPADGSDSHAELFGIGGDGADAAGLLESAQVRVGVDLHDMIIDGIEALEAARYDERLSAMVVLTDGDDPDPSATTVAEVHERLADSNVVVYVIAVGDASCRSTFFIELKGEQPGVNCFDAEPAQITTTFDNLFDRLWSGNG